MSQVQITVNDKTIMAEEGALLIEVLLRNGIEIPYFCYHEALGPDGNCRMCMVGIEGQKRPQIACDTFVKSGMVVSTQSDAIKAVRQNILELELINHPVDCPICDQAGECSLQDFYMDYGLYDSHIEMKDKVHHRKHVDLGSNVMLDQERCVLCARCTRFTSEITKTHELGIVGRGDHAHITTMPGVKLHNPYAMNVVDLCPVGALTSKDFRFTQRVWFMGSTPSVCHGCAKGCNIFIDHNREKYKDDKIYRFRPRVNKAVNGHFICDEGRLSFKALQENRQLMPMSEGAVIDRGDALKRFADLLGAHEGKILVMADANLYTEELEGIQAFAERIGAALICPMEVYRDDAFGDDWLKSPQRAANAAAVEKLGIAPTAPDDLKATLLVNFNHPDAERFGTDVRVDLCTHTGSKADLILPIAVFSECSGTLTNEEGIVQHCKQAILRNDPVFSVCEWLDHLSGGGL